MHNVSGRPGLLLVRADGRDLPFPDGTFEISLCTLTLHHLPNSDAVRFLAEMARVTRRFVVVNDLERSWLHLQGSRLLSATLWRRNPLSRHDGPTSVLNSFRADELRGLAQAAGLVNPSVRRHFPFRLVLTGEPPGGTL
jgi:hypothetical protein